MSLILASYFIRTMVVGALAGGLLLALRRQSAATQHAVAAWGLGIILLLGPASLLAPRLLTQIGGAQVVSAPKPRLALEAPAASAQTVEPAERPSLVNSSVLPPAQPQETTRSESPAPAAAFVAPLPQAVKPASTFRLGQIAAWIWLGGSLLLSLRIVGGLLAVGKRYRRSDLRGNEDGVETRVDPNAEVPIAIWWGRPVVLLPKDWKSWSEERLAAVLLHERAHLSRGDFWTRLIGLAACALAWPSPLAWWLLKQARILSEQAADDCVLLGGTSPSQYAQDLLDFAYRSRRPLPAVALSMAAKPDISRRIERILSERKRRGSAALPALVAIGAAFGLFAGGVSQWGLGRAPSVRTLAMNAPLSVTPPSGNPVMGSETGAPFQIESHWQPELEVSASPSRMPVSAGILTTAASPLEPVTPHAPATPAPARPVDHRTLYVMKFAIDKPIELSQLGFPSQAPLGSVSLTNAQVLKLMTTMGQAGFRPGPEFPATCWGNTPALHALKSWPYLSEATLSVPGTPVSTSGMRLTLSSTTSKASDFTVEVPNGTATAFLYPNDRTEGEHELWIVQPDEAGAPKRIEVEADTFLVPADADPTAFYRTAEGAFQNGLEALEHAGKLKAELVDLGAVPGFRVFMACKSGESVSATLPGLKGHAGGTLRAEISENPFMGDNVVVSYAGPEGRKPMSEIIRPDIAGSLIRESADHPGRSVVWVFHARSLSADAPIAQARVSPPRPGFTRGIHLQNAFEGSADLYRVDLPADLTPFLSAGDGAHDAIEKSKLMTLEAKLTSIHAQHIVSSALGIGDGRTMSIWPKDRKTYGMANLTFQQYPDGSTMAVYYRFAHEDPQHTEWLMKQKLSPTQTALFTVPTEEPGKSIYLWIVSPNHRPHVSHVGVLPAAADGSMRPTDPFILHIDRFDLPLVNEHEIPAEFRPAAFQGEATNAVIPWDKAQILKGQLIFAKAHKTPYETRTVMQALNWRGEETDGVKVEMSLRYDDTAMLHGHFAQGMDDPKFIKDFDVPFPDGKCFVIAPDPAPGKGFRQIWIVSIERLPSSSPAP